MTQTAAARACTGMHHRARCDTRLAAWWTVIVWSLAGCTRIATAPSCPDELAVGESGTVAANEENPGAIPTYLWEALPPDAGTFVDSNAPTTTFQALKEGEAVIRLTASDGLYQVISECHTAVVGFLAVAVSLEVNLDPVVVGESATLLCSSIGEGEAATLTLEQVEGPSVTLTTVSEGVATFTPGEVGELTFSCVGESPDGRQSEPGVVTVTVIVPPDGTGNENDNATDNDNANGDRQPPKPGR